MHDISTEPIPSYQLSDQNEDPLRRAWGHVHSLDQSRQIYLHRLSMPAAEHQHRPKLPFVLEAAALVKAQVHDVVEGNLVLVVVDVMDRADVYGLRRRRERALQFGDCCSNG